MPNDTARIMPDAVLNRISTIAPAIAAAADEIEATRRIPADLLAQLHDTKLTRLLLPKRFGGEEVAPGVYLEAVAHVARADASVAWNLFVANSAALLAAHLEPATADEIFRPANALVAWGPPNATVTTIEEGGYRVNGRWDFASGCRNATWMGVHSMIAPPGGEPVKHPDGRPVIRSLLFPASEATLIDTWDTIGLRGTASDSYTVEDVFVPDAYSGTREDPDGRREPGALYAFTQQGLYAVGVAGVALGTAEAMLDAFRDLARDKTPRGLAKLADQAFIQAGVAQGVGKLGAARAYLMETLADVYNNAPATGAIDTNARARVRLACSVAIQAPLEVADWVYKQAGVNAIFPGGPFQRRYRDIHTLSQQIQSRDSHFEAVGKVLLGNPPSVFY